MYGFPEDVEVTFAADARAAWKLLPDVEPMVLITELQTGSSGGYGLLRDMQATSRWRDLPAIVLIERDQDAWLARAAGARGVRRKPVSARQIDADIRSLVGDSAASQ
jgi:DNA-binding response OmpR family regulator